MPNNKKKSKKKQKSRNRSAAAVFCAACQKKVGNQKLRCACTRVNFCDQTCQQRAMQSGQHACPGAPSTTNQMMPTGRPGISSPLDDPNVRSAWNLEYEQSIQKHIRNTVLQEGLRGNALPEDPGPDYYASLADKGSAPCAYMAGILYKNRLLGNVRVNPRGGLQSASSGQEGAGILETDELAYKYLLQASKAGIGIAMQSLAELYIDGQGVRQRRISGNDWLWQAVLIQSAGALKLLDANALLPLEIDAMVDMMQQVRTQIHPGQPFNPSGPHLTSLLASLVIKLHRTRFQLRPFAAAAPTLTVGNQPNEGATGTVPMIGAKLLEQFWMLTDQLNRRGNKVACTYGRRGIAKAATAQTHGEQKTRNADSFLYQVPPEPQCSDQFGKDEADVFIGFLQQAEFLVQCVHCEGTGQAYYYCPRCIQLAEERLLAVSHGRVAVSLHEELLARGRSAIWRDAKGNLQSDTFKTYSRGEAEQTLAALVACEPRLAHPLFVAQDPNFFWPLIVYHGTVRAALEYVAPHEDWNTRLCNVKPPLERESIADDAIPGKTLARCGNSLCTKLECHGKLEILNFCGGCETRLYCSRECSKVDWIFHKNECSCRGGAEPPQPVRSSSASTPIFEPLREEEEVVVHGLTTKPEFNGRVGAVSGARNSDGRYPVKLDGESSMIAVKSANIYQLGVYVAARPGKARKYKCSAHHQELCDDCSLDMQIVNHLFKLRHLGQEPNAQQIEEIAELNFASLEFAESEGTHDTEPFDFRHFLLAYPIECSGVSDTEKRFVLKSLLEYSKSRESGGEKPSETILVAINGLCCYSARTVPLVRPYAVEQLKKLNF